MISIKSKQGRAFRFSHATKHRKIFSCFEFADQPITIKEIADHFGVSRQYVGRIYNKHFRNHYWCWIKHGNCRERLIFPGMFTWRDAADWIDKRDGEFTIYSLIHIGYRVAEPDWGGSHVR